MSRKYLSLMGGELYSDKDEPPSEFRYCEYGNSVKGFWHIRKLSEKGAKYSGGADTNALCGADVRWDIDVEVRPMASCCQTCIERWEAIRHA